MNLEELELQKNQISDDKQMQATVATLPRIRKLSIQHNCFIEEARLSALIVETCATLAELNGERLAGRAESRPGRGLTEGGTGDSIFKMKYLKAPSQDCSGTNLSETAKSAETHRAPLEATERQANVGAGRANARQATVLNLFKSGEQRDDQPAGASRQFQFKSFKDSIVKAKNQNTLNFNNLNILMKGGPAPMVTSFKHFAQTPAASKVLDEVPELSREARLASFRSPDKREAGVRRRRVCESMADLTFKKKFLRPPPGTRRARPGSSILLERQQADSGLLLYRTQTRGAAPALKAPPPRAPAEQAPSELLQNLKYQVTNLTCKR